jgi:alkanesulfonate monooxygenase SsuD/methylene tetrahydromethanopterin reductase-like flavin-dependent oxidoreductase (luciferase family)
MGDYGHDLLFGSFLTPRADDPQRVVELAQLSERAGLDLVTFQDHPYQPSFLDTWTLLSYVAARTERVRLAPNVANLPLRQPVVLARSAAGLDLLSGGRVELGLGAGSFWDAIEASGGRRLPPGRAVDALAEAIEIIRAVWSPGVRGGVRVDGEHYRVVGAKRGPAPAHPIGIWLGAYKPRMLRLAGRLADGSLPSLGYLPNGPRDLAAMNEQIDEAAATAGRDPAAVRRLFNITGTFGRASRGLLDGPPDQWAEELAGLTLDYGVSAFILGSDDARALQVFAEEVAPAVRDLVAEERSRPAGDPPDTEAVAATPPVAGAEAAETFTVRPTPAPATLYGARMPWDETTRPSAPPAPPGHPYSAQANAVGPHLVDVHDQLRAELEQLRDLLEQVKAGQLAAGEARARINRMTLRQNDWTLGAYCASYCRFVDAHHSLEDDAIFPYLRHRDARLGPLLDRLADEHLVIHGVLDAIDRVLVTHIGDPTHFGPLQDAVDQLTDTLLSHLAYEEQQLVEPLARHGFYPGQLRN